MSDLHLELCEDYVDFAIPKSAPYLLLAGDIGCLDQYNKYARFLRHQCSRFNHVYLVLGNHEFYQLSKTNGFKLVASLMEDPVLRDKLSILNRSRIDLNDTVTLLGCTLHSHISNEARDIVSAKVADFSRIKDWTVDNHNLEHSFDVKWLQDEIASIHNEEPRRSVIVATQHAPFCNGTSHPEHAKSPWASAFCTELMETQVRAWRGMENVKYWIFGHTHWSSAFQAENIQLLSNQRGYVLTSPLRQGNSVFRRKPIAAGENYSTFDVTKTITVS